ncbi:MAG: anti-sigma factor [Bacteroidetes bacterium]|nr:anti-sigma factor [Bacteroidota bacterium]
MNAQEYIETGLLELYVMGSLSKEEMLEVERNAQSSPEIMQEFIRVQNTLLNYAAAFELAPRPQLRANILDRVEKDARNSTSSNKENLVHLNSQKSTSNYYKFIAAACIPLILISGVGNYTFWNKLKRAESEISVLNSNKEELAQQFNTVKNSYEHTLGDVAVFRNTAFNTIVMKGIPAMDSTALAKVYWNKNTQEVFVDISNLPVPSGDKQYQLWALLDGKPVDAGVFEVGATVNGLQKMKLIAGAQAFAVTLEPRGGSVSPTLSAMYVIGNV